MRTALLAAATALALTLPLAAQEEEPKGAPAPNDIVATAAASDWVTIPADDLLVMTLAPDAEGKARQVVIQLMPAPFSEGWVHNIRLFARAKWYDGISVNRVQDNYVTQWGDPNYDNPEATGKPKPLPEGLKVMGEAEYVTPYVYDEPYTLEVPIPGETQKKETQIAVRRSPTSVRFLSYYNPFKGDSYTNSVGHSSQGWPVGREAESMWPVHCYGMVGVGRNMSPDTGSGAELYTVIGHAPRHLDRNIALVGRVIEGMQHLSSLPRGSGALGFYAAEEAGKRTSITSVRVANDLPMTEQPRFEYLSTESATFAAYAEAIANRRDPFFIVPAGGADICNIRVPVRRVAE